MHVSPVTTAAVSRRTVIAAGLLGLTVSGCRITRDSDETGSAPSTTTASPADLAPDVAVASEALALVRGLREALTATTTRIPDLAATLTAVAAMHAAHETSLVDAVPDGRAARPARRRTPSRAAGAPH